MAMAGRRIAGALSSARSCSLRQQVQHIDTSCAYWSCGSLPVMFNGVRGMAEAAVAPAEAGTQAVGAGAPTAQTRSDGRQLRSSFKDDSQKGGRRKTHSLEPFLQVARDNAGSLKAVYQLRDLQFINRAALLQNQTETVAAITDIFHQMKFDQPDAEASELESSGEDSAGQDGRFDARKVPATLEHVPVLLYNFSRVAQTHSGIRTAVIKQNRHIMQKMFEAVSVQKHKYTDPMFVAQVAASQARLRMYCRTFWKNLHVDLLDSWNASCAATLIHAYGRLYTTHSLHTGAALAEELVLSASAASQPQTECISAAEDTMPSTVASSPERTAEGSEPSIFIKKPEPVVDVTLQKLQKEALHAFHELMDSHAIAYSILSFGKQDMLEGEELEILRQGVKRTAPNMTSRHLAVVLTSFHDAGHRLGCAEDVVKRMLRNNAQAILSKMNPVSALQTLAVIQAWGWQVEEARSICLEQVQQKAGRFSSSDAAQALALFADLQAPLAEANMPLLRKLSHGANYLTPAGFVNAMKGLSWAEQEHVHGAGQERVDAVQEARAAVEAQIARRTAQSQAK